MVAVFEIGSIICAAAPTSNAFIVGRVVAGIGGTGILTGGTIVIVDLVPLQKRPLYQGFLGASFGVASVLGPTLGGLLSTKATWRWCFWINVPIGGIAIFVLALVLPKAPPPVREWNGTLREKISKFDPLGTLFLVPGLILLILGLQWGGVTYPWNSATVITLLTLGSVLLFFFAITQYLTGENATVPPRILMTRSILATAFASAGIGGSLIVATFFLPIWFQAIKSLTAVEAGVRLLPYFLFAVFAVILSGALISAIGYYTPFLIVGSAVGIVGFGLFTTLTPQSKTGEWLGYQVLIGIGLGACLQQPYNVAQATLKREDIPIGVTLIAFSNFFSGTLFVAVCQTILTNTLSSGLSRELPGFDVAAIATTGATKIRDLVPQDKLPIVLDVYNGALVKVFYVALALAGLAFVPSLFVEWKTVKTKKVEKEAEKGDTESKK